MRRGRRVPGLATGITWATVCAVLVTVPSCKNPFQTGKPEFPGGVQVNYPQPTSPVNVLEIVRLALGAKDNPKYLEQLAPDFEFFPDQVQAQTEAFRNFPAAWHYAQEEAYLAGLFSNADSLSLSWSDVFTRPEGNSAHVTATYNLAVRTAGGAVTHYRGQAEIVMQQAAGLWSIEVWQDLVVNNDDTTWGLLRAQLLATG